MMVVARRNRDNGQIYYYKVYDITYDNTGYPHFLIYQEGQWLRVSAKHYRPLVPNEEAHLLNI